MHVIRRKHVRIRDVVRFHLLDVFGIRAPLSARSFAQREMPRLNIFSGFADMLENLENQDRIERPVAKRKHRIYVNHRQSVRRAAFRR